MNFPLNVIAEKLRERGKTLAVAESCTGGMLAEMLTAIPGASAFFRGGAVTYATETKTDLLGVPAELIATHGVVSARCAEAMANGVADKFRAEFALSTTGVAGPDGGTDENPVGTVFIGLKTPGKTEAIRFRAQSKTRDAIRREATLAALTLLANAL